MKIRRVIFVSFWEKNRKWTDSKPFAFRVYGVHDYVSCIYVYRESVKSNCGESCTKWKSHHGNRKRRRFLTKVKHGRRSLTRSIGLVLASSTPFCLANVLSRYINSENLLIRGTGAPREECSIGRKWSNFDVENLPETEKGARGGEGRTGRGRKGSWGPHLGFQAPGPVIWEHHLLPLNNLTDIQYRKICFVPYGNYRVWERLLR